MRNSYNAALMSCGVAVLPLQAHANYGTMFNRLWVKVAHTEWVGRMYDIYICIQ